MLPRIPQHLLILVVLTISVSENESFQFHRLNVRNTATLKSPHHHRLYATIEKPTILEEPTLILDEDDEYDDDEFLDDVVCARGVCVLVDEDYTAEELCTIDEDSGDIVCEVNEAAVQPGLSVAYLWPRAMLLICSVLYGTNFPLGRMMNDALPASANIDRHSSIAGDSSRRNAGRSGETSRALEHHSCRPLPRSFLPVLSWS